MGSGTLLAPFGLTVLAYAVAFAVVGAAVTVVVFRRVLARASDHEEMSRLLAASARTARLRTFDDALATATHEVRTLLGARAAICCSLDAHGEWVGMIADSDGGRAATPDAVATLRELIADDETARSIELSGHTLSTRLSLPPARKAIVAVGGEVAMPLVVAAFCDGGHDAHRVTMLGQFAPQAALSVANAHL